MITQGAKVVCWSIFTKFLLSVVEGLEADLQ